MYRIFLSFILLTTAFSLIQPAFSATRTITTRKPTPYNYPNNYTTRRNPMHYYNYNRPTYNVNRNTNRPYHHIRRNSSYFSDINSLEKYSMNRSFANESDLDRIERLEMQAFGAIQQGDITSRYDNVKSAILSRPKQNYKTSLLKNVSDYFTGQMTGYTPSLSSFGSSNPYLTPMSGFSTTNYPSTYGNSSVTEFSGPFGSGYRVDNFGTGSSAGVRILD